jgi:hypothetical protein
VIDVLGIDPSTLEKLVKDWTSEPAVNEDLVLSILDLIFSHVLKTNETKQRL